MTSKFRDAVLQGKELEEGVSAALRAEGVTFLVEPSIKGARPDIVVTLPDGRLLVLELKVARDSRNLVRAVEIAERYKDDDTFFVAMAPAAETIGASCIRIDVEEFTGDIVEEIKARINGSSVVIADLSDSKPNVLYEVGYAHGLNKPTIHVCSSDLSKLPFDVRNWNTIRYKKGQTFKLRDLLVSRLKATPSGLP